MTNPPIQRGEASDSGLPQRQTAALVEIYRAAAARMRAIILDPPGRTEASKEWNASRAAQQLQQVERLIDQLKAAAADWVSDGRDGSPGPVRSAMAAGIALGNKQAAEVGVAPADDAARGAFALVDSRAVAFFAREIAIDLNKAADGMGDTARKVLRTTRQLGLGEADINKILAGGLIAGKPTQTIRDLRQALRAVHGDTVTVTGKNGEPIHFKAGYYASMVARTQTRDAAVHARHRRLEELDLDLVAIIGRVSRFFCTAFLGQVFSLSGKSSKYPAYSTLPGGGPPFHPNCSKGTRPFIEALASDKQNDLADGLDDAGKLLNVDAAEAQRRYKDLQIEAQQKDNYASTAKALFAARK